MSDFIDDSLMKDWFEEAYSQVDLMESNLLTLEKNSDDKDAIDAIFRAAHTLKGGSATVNMEEITKFTHTLEDTMDEVRNGKIEVDSTVVDILLDSLDIIKGMIEARSEGEVYSEDYSSTTEQLKGLTMGISPQTAAEEVKPLEEENQLEESQVEESSYEGEPLQAGEAHDLNLSEYDILELNEANPDNLPVYTIKVVFNENNPMRTVGGIQVFTSLRDIAAILKTIPDFDELYSEEFHQEVIYIVAADKDMELLEEYSTITDTTDSVTVTPFGKEAAIPVKEATTAPVEPEERGPQEKKKKTSTEIEDMARMITQEAISSIDDRNQDKLMREISEAQEEVQKNAEKKSAAPPSKKKKSQDQQKNVTSSVLRVDSSRIDDLLNLVSEIVINKATFNQINSQFVENLDAYQFSLNNYKDTLKSFIDRLPQIIESAHEKSSLSQVKKEIIADFTSVTSQFDQFAMGYKSITDKLKTTNQNLDRISSSLQEGVMRVRMVQIKQIFSRFPRLVRDLCRDLKKQVQLVIEGEETEVDKAMIDDLIDPLIHIVRNAIDHGFESPAERESSGKKIPGTLKLQALNEGNLISIYVSDDGKGINAESIRKKGIEKGLITADAILRKNEIYNLLFEPGFSTAAKITSVSGRGVGLDVVKKNIEKLSGTIRITSEEGKGTTFAIKLPLTLAIIQGLMIRVSDEIYALPISSVLDSLRISPDDIKSIDNYEVINVRDDVLSLLRLSKLFNIEPKESQEYYFVVIVGTGDKKIALLVDALIGEEDIVIKPLKDKYTNTPGIAGATIYDGAVSLILDVSQLIELGLKQGIEAKSRNQFLNGGTT